MSVTHYYNDAETIVLDTGRDCFGKRLGFSELEWDKHLGSTEVPHRIAWEDGHKETRP